MRRLARWNVWANDAVLSTLEASHGEPPAALAAYQHVLETELVWLRRIAADSRPMLPLWGESSLKTVVDWTAEATQSLAALMGRLDESGLGGTFAYRNSAGTALEDRTDEVLLHMLMHSSQYRGEAAGFLNATGRRVPDVDLIFWMRQGEPQPARPK